VGGARVADPTHTLYKVLRLLETELYLDSVHPP
jgi:hypothetical protein